MLLYRNISGKIINLSVDDQLYLQQQKLFDAIFRTFIKTNKCDLKNRYSYFILAEKPHDLGEIMNYTICDTKKNDWFFVLVSDLEYFFADVLDCTVLHGTIVKIADKCVLLLGERYSGKSTLASYLSFECQGEPLDDDCVYIENNTYIGFGFPLSLRNVCSEIDMQYYVGDTLDEDGVKRSLFAPPYNLSIVSKIDAIAFVKYNKNCENRILSSNEAFYRLIKNIRHHRNIKILFEDVLQLANSTVCFELKYPNCQEAFQMIMNNLRSYIGFIN